MLHPLIFVFCAASQLAITRASSLASSVEHNREVFSLVSAALQLTVAITCRMHPSKELRFGSSSSLTVAEELCRSQATDFIVLNPANFSKNFHDDLWASENVPFFECSDEDITTAYFYRWQVYK